VILREEHRIRVFENRVQRRIFSLRGDEVTGGSKKLLNGSYMTCTPLQI
jgi:hypothetical protein